MSSGVKRKKKKRRRKPKRVLEAGQFTGMPPHPYLNQANPQIIGPAIGYPNFGVPVYSK